MTSDEKAKLRRELMLGAEVASKNREGANAKAFLEALIMLEQQRARENDAKPSTIDSVVEGDGA
jgi:hypothetical protein